VSYKRFKHGCHDIRSAEQGPIVLLAATGLKQEQRSLVEAGGLGGASGELGIPGAKKTGRERGRHERFA
jgi:hypothetical protein